MEYTDQEMYQEIGDMDREVIRAREKISANIVRILDEQNVSQAALAKKTGLSESNIRELLKGRINYGIDSINKIAFALDVNVIDLWRNTGIEGIRIEEQVEEARRIQEETRINDLLYPYKYSDCFGEYQITSLFEFLIYLPLFDLWKVRDMLRRVGAAGPFGQERYVLEQLNYLVNSIPNSPERRYADKYVELIREVMRSKDAEVKTWGKYQLDREEMMAYDNLTYWGERSLVEYSDK